jgi:hypothetical protein
MTPLPLLPKPASVPEEASTRTTQTSTDSLLPSRLDQRPPVTEAERLQEAYQIPSLHLAPNSKPSPRKAPGHIQPSPKHGRSMSHPFPSLFQSKEKGQGTTSSAPLEFTDDDTQSSDFQSPSTTNLKNPTRVADKDLMTGKCMTCNSTVRWPKELFVFRCTVCMTINDLKPAAVLPLHGYTQNGQSSPSLWTNYGTQSSSRGRRHADFLSLIHAQISPS